MPIERRETVLLVDGDLVLYRNASASEREVHWDDENIVLQTNLARAWESIQATIQGYVEALSADRVVLTFTQGPSFRKAIDPTYKAHRKGTRMPLGYNDLKLKALETYESKSLIGLEADDVMGILATKPGKSRRIIVSDDKDMQGIPGEIYRGGELAFISDSAADYWFMTQTLIGDPADGYPGLPGCGAKTAEKILHEALDGLGSMSLGATTLDHMWLSVVAAFNAKGFSESEALLQARLARILRWSDWDHVNKTPILWSP